MGAGPHEEVGVDSLPVGVRGDRCSGDDVAGVIDGEVLCIVGHGGSPGQ